MKDVNALCVCVIKTRVMLECRCPDMTRTKREPFIRALRVLCKTCRPNSEASYVGRVFIVLSICQRSCLQREDVSFRQEGVIRDFKIGHYGRLGRLDRCHVTQKTRDLLPSSFWDGMFSSTVAAIQRSTVIG